MTHVYIYADSCLFVNIYTGSHCPTAPDLKHWPYVYSCTMTLQRTQLVIATLLLVAVPAAIATSAQSPFSIAHNATHLSVTLNDILLVEHSPSSPFVFAGSGSAEIKSKFGNYKIRDYVEGRVPLGSFYVASPVQREDGGTSMSLLFSDSCSSLQVSVNLVTAASSQYMEFASIKGTPSRLWIRLHAEEGEKVYGAGEQFTYFNMRGKTFPIWIQEQGVGRNKSSLITLLATQRDGGGGDYYTTYWAQPTYLSTRKYYAHFSTLGYSEFDFHSKDFHEIYMWDGLPGRLTLFTGETYLELMTQFTGYQGRQPAMPDWVYNGAVLGLQGGTKRMLQYYNLAKECGIKVSGLWIQDWAGRIKTSFGRRIFWNWEWDPKHYPNLDNVIASLKKEGVTVLVYANLNLNQEGNLFREAEDLGYLILNQEGGTYVVDYGEFFCGIVDITNPDAAQWFKDRIIKQNMIDLGVGGWMADFGEYLPTDAVFYNGQSGAELHNVWPTLWAKINREAVEEAGKLGEILYWMRAGFTGSQQYGVMTWAGDQFVDFSINDGLASVIPAALSLGVSGFGLFHFDIGGYTSLFDYHRTEELMFRYGEMAAFTTMMRTHEGNRPDENLQFYSNPRTLSELSYHTRIFYALNEYRRIIIAENSDHGIPVQRPLFMHYETDEASFDIQYEYLFGPDLLVAPVYLQGQDTWDVYLPPDSWVFLWDEAVTSQGGETVNVPAPIGKIPVFFREKSQWASLFREIRNVESNQTIGGNEGVCYKGDESCKAESSNDP